METRGEPDPHEGGGESGDPAPRRIVSGRNDETYYTDDHYSTFTKVK